MRNLRFDLRKLSEPMTIFTVKEVETNGVLSYQDDQEYKCYGHVMMNINQYDLQNDAAQSNTMVKIQLRRNEKINWVAGQTKILIRGQTYIFQRAELSQINSEMEVVHASVLQV